MNSEMIKIAFADNEEMLKEAGLRLDMGSLLKRTTPNIKIMGIPFKETFKETPYWKAQDALQTLRAKNKLLKIAPSVSVADKARGLVNAKARYKNIETMGLRRGKERMFNDALANFRAEKMKYNKTLPNITQKYNSIKRKVNQNTFGLLGKENARWRYNKNNGPSRSDSLIKLLKMYGAKNVKQ